MFWFDFVSTLPEGQTPIFRIHCPLRTDLINFIFMSEPVEDLYLEAHQPDSIAGRLPLGETQIIWHQSNLIFFLPLKPVFTYLRFCHKFPVCCYHLPFLFHGSWRDASSKASHVMEHSDTFWGTKRQDTEGTLKWLPAQAWSTSRWLTFPSHTFSFYIKEYQWVTSPHTPGVSCLVTPLSSQLSKS